MSKKEDPQKLKEKEALDLQIAKKKAEKEEISLLKGKWTSYVKHGQPVLEVKFREDESYGSAYKHIKSFGKDIKDNHNIPFLKNVGFHKKHNFIEIVGAENARIFHNWAAKWHRKLNIKLMTDLKGVQREYAIEAFDLHQEESQEDIDRAMHDYLTKKKIDPSQFSLLTGKPEGQDRSYSKAENKKKQHKQEKPSKQRH